MDDKEGTILTVMMMRDDESRMMGEGTHTHERHRHTHKPSMRWGVDDDDKRGCHSRTGTDSSVLAGAVGECVCACLVFGWELRRFQCQGQGGRIPPDVTLSSRLLPETETDK